MKQLNNQSDNGPYNKEVRTAYYQILKEAKALLATIEREELRYTLIREDKPIGNSICCIIHEMVNPLIYLRLDSYEDGAYGIRYGFASSKYFAHITVAFTRFLYKVTMKGATSNNIENSIRTEWYIHNPDEMYEHIEEQMKHHQFALIKHKPVASRRKLQVVA
jgi:hypothetical protein